MYPYTQGCIFFNNSHNAIIGEFVRVNFHLGSFKEILKKRSRKLKKEEVIGKREI